MVNPIKKPRSLKAKRALAAIIFERFQTENPHPKGELNWHNPYQLLVAVTLSAQATDIGVNKATDTLFKIVNSPANMVALGEAGLIEHIKTIGLFRTKAANVMKMAHLLIEHHQGIVPADRDALEALPGVGRKTANVVLNIAFGVPTIAVDTHLFRLAHRLGLSVAKTPLGVEQDLLKIIPEAYMMHAHHWLILHGRYICKARKPDCKNCILINHCPSAIL
ncbi:MAG: endonuclease III [Alphaproteobacteria bacterium]